MLLIMLIQVVSQQVQPAPDIQLRARVTAREVRIERSGEASLVVSGGEGSEVRVEAPRANGQRRLRNASVTIDAKANVSARGATALETSRPD